MRLAKGAPKLRNQLAREVFRRALVKQTRRSYSNEFQVVHFSIQDDHVHLIVEAFVPSEPAGPKKGETKRHERDGMALRRGAAAGVSSTDVAQRHERDGMALRRIVGCGTPDGRGADDRADSVRQLKDPHRQGWGTKRIGRAGSRSQHGEALLAAGRSRGEARRARRSVPRRGGRGTPGEAVRHGGAGQRGGPDLY
jgi:hypothetical protein